MKKLFIALIMIGIIAVAYFMLLNKKTTKDVNPFFAEYNTPFKVPPFDKIKIGHYMPAFEEGMRQEKAEVETILNNPEEPTFENTIVPYTERGQFLDRATAVFYGLNSANTTPEIQALASKISPILSAHNDEIRLNPKLFEKIKAVYEKRNESNLDKQQMYIIENLYKGFVQGGANLPDEEKEQLKEINKTISSLSTQFGQNLLAETNNFKLIIEDEKDLEGLNESVIANGAQAAKAAGLEGKWVFTTQRTSMYPFLTYSKKRDLRKKLYTAYTMRGNNNNENDNKKITAEIAKLRVQKAKLLGYNSHADLILSTRMAKNADNVYDLLYKVWWPSLKVAKKELADMQKIADKNGDNIKIAAWDWWYYAEKLRTEKYNLKDSELRPYFELKNVLEGLFYAANKLYGITFTEIQDIPKPHPDAYAYEVKEANGDHLGVLYQDFFPRASKRGGAWCGGYRSFHYENGKPISPISTMVTNVAQPTEDTPALLSLDHITTIFHEFGHALDGLFSNLKYQISFRARDFTELPSQIMEHWALHPDVLKVYAKHYQTGETIPDELIHKIENSGLFNQGFITVEFVAAALLDMQYHTLTEPVDLDVEKFEKEFFDKIKLIPEITSRYRTTYFNHIWASGYSAGYYSYLWSGVLDNDAFEAFVENGLFDQKTANSFRYNVLAPNGLMDPEEMYLNFRGKEPSIEPLLRSRGLIK